MLIELCNTLGATLSFPYILGLRISSCGSRYFFLAMKDHAALSDFKGIFRR